ncbi:acyltransferase family protein [Ramlibacter pallidus]|uniref:Acyltransferase n=1 Tax=Ramlibacter pallidus TaxID=2780087 RepID=A0ABR9S3U8_9BURK|nr:acyltransferase [Ramlibacter pallidus]MBE7368200.1 acyltransferase [Ramlibacter pallidus]
MQRIRGFDGLRALAVLSVIAFHAEAWRRIGLHDGLAALLNNLGVPLFFVLSGFLITSLLLAETRHRGSVDVWAFYARRALRILPLYLLALLLLFALEYFQQIRLSRCTWAHAVTHTLNFAGQNCQFAALSHFWSLAVEEHFYLFWPLAFLAGPRFAFVVLLVVVAVCQGMLWTGVLAPFEATHDPSRWTLPGVLPIAVGGIAAFYVESSLSKAAFVTRARLVVLAVACAVVYFERLTATWYAAIACILLFVYYNQDGVLTRLLEWRPLAFLGTISYGLYVWQGVLGGNGAYREFPNFPPPLEIGLLLTFVVAPVSYYCFERPIMRLKKRFRRAPDLQGPGPVVAAVDGRSPSSV